jgi:succinyl-CoA synthetase beta subunit
MTREQAAGVAAQVGLAGQKDETADMLLRMYDLFMKKDASLIEVNPYAEDANGKCKIILNLKKIRLYDKPFVSLLS